MKKNYILPLALAGAMPAVAQAADHTNFVVINLDDAGNGDFSYLGAVGYTTPNIDRLAAEGMSFTNFYAVQPISGASRAGLMTGCYPNRIGFSYAPNPNSPIGLGEQEQTIAQVLKKRDYATGIFGKWHLGDAEQFLPLQKGFDEWYGLPYSNDMWPYHPTARYPDLPLYDGNRVAEKNPDMNKLTTEYTERSVKFIRENTERPFFLYLAHAMPHVPLGVSDKFRGKSEIGIWGDVMMELDWSVGEVLKALEEAGLAENTLVIFTSDNGPWANYGNHAGSSGGLREAKATTFNGGLRVPFVAYWKGTIDGGVVYNQLASNIDVLPTLAELAGAPLPDHKIDGNSMTAVLKGETSKPVRDGLCLYYHKNSLEAVTDGRYKLIFPHKYVSYEVYAPGNDGRPGRLGEKEVDVMELYDLRRDPGERVNVIEQHPEVADRLIELANRCRFDIGDELTGYEGTGRRPLGRVAGR